MINEYKTEGNTVEMVVSDKQILFDLDDFLKLNRFNQWKLSRGKSVVTDYRDKEKMLRITLHRLITGSKFVKWLNGNIFDFRKENIIPVEKAIRPRPTGVNLKGNKCTLEKNVVILTMEVKGVSYEAYVDYEDYPLVSGYTWNVNTKTGYVQTKERLGRLVNKGLYLHRAILGVTDSETSIDHINGNRLDNRRCNLRICSISQNHHNKEIHRNGIAGVSMTRGGHWAAQMMIGGVSHRKQFKTHDDAVAQYRVWEQEFNPSGLKK